MLYWENLILKLKERSRPYRDHFQKPIPTISFLLRLKLERILNLCQDPQHLAWSKK